MYGATNNPFMNAGDPSHPISRFPDISGEPQGYPSQQYGYQQPQQQQGYNTTPSYMQQQPYANQYQQQPQQYPQQTFGNQAGYLSPGGSMQGQYGGMSPPPGPHLQQSGSGAYMSGTSYGYLSGQQTELPQQQMVQQQPNSPNYGNVAQFDPYGPLGQWDGTAGQQQPQQQQQQQQQYQGYHDSTGQYLIAPVSPVGQPTGVSPPGSPHPREFIRSHKAQLDRWDSNTWKELLATFEILKGAWGSRKTACNAQLGNLKSQLNFAGYYQQQVQSEIARIEQLVKDADTKSDSVAASAFQMQEVFAGYRQSADASSKARVREATNAAVNSLPDWPPATI